MGGQQGGQMGGQQGGQMGGQQGGGGGGGGSVTGMTLEGLHGTNTTYTITISIDEAKNDLSSITPLSVPFTVLDQDGNALPAGYNFAWAPDGVSYHGGNKTWSQKYEASTIFTVKFKGEAVTGGKGSITIEPGTATDWAAMQPVTQNMQLTGQSGTTSLSVSIAIDIVQSGPHKITKDPPKPPPGQQQGGGTTSTTGYISPVEWAKRLIAKSASQKAAKNLFVNKAGFIGEYKGGIARRVLRQNEKLILLAPAPKNQVSQTKLSGAKKSTAIMKMRWPVISSGSRSKISGRKRR